MSLKTKTKSPFAYLMFAFKQMTAYKWVDSLTPWLRQLAVHALSDCTTVFNHKRSQEVTVYSAPPSYPGHLIIAISQDGSSPLCMLLCLVGYNDLLHPVLCCKDTKRYEHFEGLRNMLFSGNHQTIHFKSCIMNWYTPSGPGEATRPSPHLVW